jgi:hypothetical protein
MRLPRGGGAYIYTIYTKRNTMLDYNYRSKCCFAPIRLGRKTVKKTNQKILIWICCKCGERDVDIIPKDAQLDQVPTIGPFDEDQE